MSTKSSEIGIFDHNPDITGSKSDLPDGDQSKHPLSKMTSKNTSKQNIDNAKSQPTSKHESKRIINQNPKSKAHSKPSSKQGPKGSNIENSDINKTLSSKTKSKLSQNQSKQSQNKIFSDKSCQGSNRVSNKSVQAMNSVGRHKKEKYGSSDYSDFDDEKTEVQGDVPLSPIDSRQESTSMNDPASKLLAVGNRTKDDEDNEGEGQTSSDKIQKLDDKSEGSEHELDESKDNGSNSQRNHLQNDNSIDPEDHQKISHNEPHPSGSNKDNDEDKSEDRKESEKSKPGDENNNHDQENDSNLRNSNDNQNNDLEGEDDENENDNDDDSAEGEQDKDDTNVNDDEDSKNSHTDNENSENHDDSPADLHPKLKNMEDIVSHRHDYSEIDSEDEVFELPSNSESFKAGTIFRISNN